MPANRSLLLKCLVNLGMSQREAKVYLALLDNKNATAAELHKPSGIPRTKVYEIIKRLVHKGYCRERKAGNRRTYEAANPQIALASSFRELENRFQESVEVKKDLEALYAASDEVSEPAEYVEMLHGKEIIHYHYCQLVRNAKEEILGFGRPPYAADTPEKLEEQGRAYDAFSALEGTTSRWVYELVYPEHKWLLPILEQGQEMGEGYRIADSLPLKMMVFDRRQVLVAQEDPYAPSGELTMTIIKQSAIANAFCALFEYFWDHSIDFDEWKCKVNVTKQEEDKTAVSQS